MPTRTSDGISCYTLSFPRYAEDHTVSLKSWSRHTQRHRLKDLAPRDTVNHIVAHVLHCEQLVESASPHLHLEEHGGQLAHLVKSILGGEEMRDPPFALFGTGVDSICIFALLTC